MQPNMNPGHHNDRHGQPLTEEQIKVLLAAQSNQPPTPAANPAVTEQPLLKQPPGYGETKDSDIADMIDAAIW
jgi:hypothetical protein